jgi:hypothetical protein
MGVDAGDSGRCKVVPDGGLMLAAGRCGTFSAGVGGCGVLTVRSGAGLKRVGPIAGVSGLPNEVDGGRGGGWTMLEAGVGGVTRGTDLSAAGIA